MKNKVRIIENHQIITPATELQTYVGGDVVSIIDVPEKVITYTCGQEFIFNNKKAAQEFIKALSGKAELI